MPAKWSAEDERNYVADRTVLKKLEARGEEPSAWLLEEYQELTERRKLAKPRRRKGDGGVYQRADGLWCVSLELPEGLDGKRRRKVICRKQKDAVIAELRAAKKELEKLGNLETSGTTLNEWAAPKSTLIEAIAYLAAQVTAYRDASDEDARLFVAQVAGMVERYEERRTTIKTRAAA